MSEPRPVLYSFRRCPYAMRARLALHDSGCAVEHREILLRDKPQAMLDASPKGTVPVLVLQEGQVLEESLDIMLWALARNDPENWLDDRDTSLDLIARCDTGFKPHLDRYKYATRYDGADPFAHREAACEFLPDLDHRLSTHPALTGARLRLADIAIFPFVRQFAHTDRDWFDGQRWTALRAWLDSHLGSQRFAAIMKKYPVWAPGATETPGTELG